MEEMSGSRRCHRTLAVAADGPSMQPELMTCEDVVGTGTLPLYRAVLGILSAERITGGRAQQAMELVHA